jgi:hypothetical protein
MGHPQSVLRMARGLAKNACQSNASRMDSRRPYNAGRLLGVTMDCLETLPIQRLANTARVDVANAPDEVSDVSEAHRYLSAYEVIHYLADDSKWGDETREHISTDGRLIMRKMPLFEAPVEFKRLAEEGKIKAVGRLNGADQHIDIPEMYWMTATLSTSALNNPEISQTIPAVPNQDGVPIYKDVRISRADVERMWPRSLKDRRR